MTRRQNVTAASPARKARKPRTGHDNGKSRLSEYVATVTMEHFIIVKAASEEMARKRALIEVVRRIGAGRSPQVTEIEELTP